MASRNEIVAYCDELLQAGEYRDIALNGLQIEGTPEINSLTVAVSCNQRSIDAAIEQESDAILVHHGLVLNDQVGHIVGPVRRRLKGILENDINLIAYHLPLDGHPEIGNNACLMSRLGLTMLEPLDVFGPMPIGYIAETKNPRTVDTLLDDVLALTGRDPVLLPGSPDQVSRVAVLSGSGYPALEEAASKGCQAMITGDAREPTMGMARELGISVIVGGHEATERLGVQALAERLHQQYGVEYAFVADPNPL